MNQVIKKKVIKKSHQKIRAVLPAHTGKKKDGKTKPGTKTQTETQLEREILFDLGVIKLVLGMFSRPEYFCLTRAIGGISKKKNILAIQIIGSKPSRSMGFLKEIAHAPPSVSAFTTPSQNHEAEISPGCWRCWIQITCLLVESKITNRK